MTTSDDIVVGTAAEYCAMSPTERKLEDMGLLPDEGATFFNGYEDAVVGTTVDGRVAYSYDAILALLMENDGMGRDEAVDFVDYNVLRCLPYMGPLAPVIVVGMPCIDE